jgi:ribosomal protein S18 acetylase RimI-like enzyme
MPIRTWPVGWRWREAVELCVSPLPDDVRPEVADELLRDTKCGVVSLCPSRIVVEKRTLIGCVIAARHPDSSWHLQLPVVSDIVTDEKARDEIQRALLADLACEFDGSDSWIAQILLSPEQQSDSQLLTKGGFPVLTDLIFMSAPTVAGAEQHYDAGPSWKAVNWSESTRPRFETVISATYEGTLDCPELNGRRSGQQAVLGHESSGPFQSALWKIYSHDGEDSGITLARCHADNWNDGQPEGIDTVFEIVYLGVTPHFRGRGLGRKMLADLFADARRQGVSEIMLAVDVRNTPAIRLYEQFGFREFDRRRVHARLG